ncbi:hypothetical protein [Streptomyces avermitilis]|nr:hypothetical protein [Streptomyces avermitilis]
MALLHQDLHPVPQRISRLVERAVALAWHGPALSTGCLLFGLL